MATSVEAIVESVRQAGIDLVVDGNKLLMVGPEGCEADLRAWLPTLRGHKTGIIAALQGSVPPSLRCVRILSWNLKHPPVDITQCSVVVDPAKFAETTLRQLEVALAGSSCLAGNWSVRDLCERLEQVGVTVAIEQTTETP